MILGIGINDSGYVVNKGGRSKSDLCPIYSMWHNMLKRCYDEKTQNKRPTYKGCSVCDEWLTFSKFRSWVICQDWKGKQLDKDILKEGNKIYSPKKCILVSNRINNLARAIGDVCGASLHKPTNKYRSYFSINRKQNHLGLFNNIKDALIKSADFKVKHILADDEINSDKVLFGAFVLLCQSYMDKIAELPDTFNIEIT